MTLFNLLLALVLLVVALYAFRLLSTPYLGAFRFVFYLLLVLLALSVWYAASDRPNQGYDPTVEVNKPD